MAVRFLPGPEERGSSVREDRTDLAEVIELRSRLPKLSRPSGGGSTEARPEEPESEESESEEPEFDYARAAEQCKEDGVKVLARQARSNGELRDALLRLDHDRSVVEDIIDEFERSLYLDDTGLARAVTEKLRDAKRASRGQIRVKLRERQIRDDVIEAVLGELEDDQELELLREAAAERARKLSDLDRQTAERRLMGFLARRGWSGTHVIAVVREALDASAGVDRTRMRGGGVKFQ